MNLKRPSLIIAVICILAVGIFLFLTFSGKKPVNNIGSSNQNNQSAPFGNSSNDKIDTSKPNSVATTPTSTQQINLSDAKLIEKCNSSVSIEKNDCIKKVAVENKKPSVCSAILGTAGQTDCKNSINISSEKITDVFSKAVTSADFTLSGNQNSLKTPESPSSTGGVINKVTEVLDYIKNKTNSNFTLEGFISRVMAVPIRLFSFSDYQIKPGSATVANGLGFSKTGNDIHIGSYTVSNLSSDDGLTINFTIPQNIPEGTYEIWATNASGSSQKSDQRIQVIITNNPAPRPVITGVSPENPTFSDTVTLTGQNLAGATHLLTSFGVINKFSSTGSSVTFNISDSEVVPRIKDLKTIKGRKISLSVTVATPQGYNKDVFTFNVQF